MADYEKYIEWLSLSKRLKKLKEDEMKLRKELCSKIFGGKVGAQKEKLKEGNLKIDAESKISYKLDNTQLKAMWDELSDAEKESTKWTAALAMTNYRKLNPDSLIHECVTTKPAAPTLKITILED